MWAIDRETWPSSKSATAPSPVSDPIAPAGTLRVTGVVSIRLPDAVTVALPGVRRSAPVLSASRLLYTATAVRSATTTPLPVLVATVTEASVSAVGAPVWKEPGPTSTPPAPGEPAVPAAPPAPAVVPPPPAPPDPVVVGLGRFLVAEDQVRQPAADDGEEVARVAGQVGVAPGDGVRPAGAGAALDCRGEGEHAEVRVERVRRP